MFRIVIRRISNCGKMFHLFLLARPLCSCNSIVCDEGVGSTPCLLLQSLPLSLDSFFFLLLFGMSVHKRFGSQPCFPLAVRSNCTSCASCSVNNEQVGLQEAHFKVKFFRMNERAVGSATGRGRGVYFLLVFARHHQWRQLL